MMTGEWWLGLTRPQPSLFSALPLTPRLLDTSIPAVPSACGCLCSALPLIPSHPINVTLPRRPSTLVTTILVQAFGTGIAGGLQGGGDGTVDQLKAKAEVAISISNDNSSGGTGRR